jgi:hypothetical protein
MSSGRRFLRIATGESAAGLFCPREIFAAPFEKAAAAVKGKMKTTDVKCMRVRGTWDWNLIKVDTDSGLYGRI